MYGEDRFVPVKQGEELDVKIEAAGEKGDGIAKKDGFVLFVPNTQVGDEVRIKVTKVLKKVGFAEVVGQISAPAEGAAPAPEEPSDSEDFGDEAEDSEDFGEEESDEAAEEPREEEAVEEVAEEPAEDAGDEAEDSEDDSEEPKTPA